MILEKVRVNNLINLYPLDTLKCFERPKLILTECMRENAMLYRMLFNEWKYSEVFDEFLEKKTGVKFIKVYGDLPEFHKIIRNQIEYGRPIMLKIDHLYEELWKNSIPNEHEAHTVIVKGVNEEEYILIDEDYSQNYFDVKNVRKRMDYCERRIKKEKLFFLASNSYQAFTDDGGLDKNHFVYYYPIKIDEREECLASEIENDFKIMIRGVYDQLNQHIDTIEYGIECAISNFDSILNSKEIDYNYKYIWLNYDGYAVPQEVFNLFFRATTLKMYQIFFENVGFSDFPNDECVDKLKEVRSYYEQCKSLFRKSVLSKKTAPCLRIPNSLKYMLESERNFYELFL